MAELKAKDKLAAVQKAAGIASDKSATLDAAEAEK